MRIITDKELRLEALKYAAGNTYFVVRLADEIYQWLKTGEVVEVESKERKEDE